MIEKIGKILIDDTHYPGKDLYCDGVVEDEILEIVKSVPPSEYRKVIEEKADWPILYHLSSLRENIVNWIPLKPKAKVLEVGSGCGAITGALAAKAGSVTCIELSKKRSLINAYRHPQCDNVTIKLGNFQEIEPELDRDYDYIFLIGVFEYAQSYIGGDKPFETFMAILQRHLSADGRMVIAIENRFGLKYWAGCKEDHLGTYFDGIEGYPHGGGVRTFTRRGLTEICKANGISEYSFYYPYPDYKFMTTVYSDERLPMKGELSNNMRNFDRDRMLLFDEKNVFDSLLEEQLFEQFSNSYVLVVGKPLPVIYARFSNDRAPEYAIRTAIYRETESRKRMVRKIPLTKQANAHVARLEENYKKLSEIYEGSGLVLNRCHLEGAQAVLEYLEGPTLEKLLDECLEKNDMDGFHRLFEKYCGYVSFPKESDIYNFDLIFGNIIVSGDTWNLIDYEWVYEGNISAEELIVRALYCYGLGSEKRKKISLDLIKGKYKYSEEQIEQLIQRERRFQQMTTGGRMSMVEIRNAIDYPIVPATGYVHQYMEEEHRNRIQIYEDYGNGFSEENSYFFVKRYAEKEAITVKIVGKKGLCALRIDPSLDYCMVLVKNLQIGGEEISLKDKRIKLNGKLISANSIAFATQDSNITLQMQAPLAKETEICAVLEVIRISEEMAVSIVGNDAKRNVQKGFLWFGK